MATRSESALARASLAPTRRYNAAERLAIGGLDAGRNTARIAERSTIDSRQSYFFIWLDRLGQFAIRTELMPMHWVTIRTPALGYRVSTECLQSLRRQPSSVWSPPLERCPEFDIPPRINKIAYRLEKGGPNGPSFFISPTRLFPSALSPPRRLEPVLSTLLTRSPKHGQSLSCQDL